MSDLKCVKWNGSSYQVQAHPTNGWINKEVIGPVYDIDGKHIADIVILYYPDGSRLEGAEYFDTKPDEIAVEMPRQDISSMFEEKVKQLQNDMA